MTPEQRKILTKHSPEGWTPGTEIALQEIVAAERERCAKIAEGEPYEYRYRTWPWQTPDADGTRANLDKDNLTVVHADRIAAAIRGKL